MRDIISCRNTQTSVTKNSHRDKDSVALRPLDFLLSLQCCFALLSLLVSSLVRAREQRPCRSNTAVSIKSQKFSVALAGKGGDTCSGRRNKRQGRNQHPQNAILKPQITGTTCFHRKPENETVKFRGSKSWGNNTLCCSDKGAVLGKGGGCYRFLWYEWLMQNKA